MLDLQADMATFFNPKEFASRITIEESGSIPFDVNGIVSIAAMEKMERPGGNNNNGFNPFAANGAEFNMHSHQVLTSWLPVLDRLAECPITIHDGPYAGAYIIRFTERDGALSRFILNKQ